MEENQRHIPEGWKLKNLGSVCRIKKGVQFNRVELSDSGMYPCINGGIEPSGYSDLWNTKENTITISEGGNSCGYVNFIATKFWSGGHCYSLEDLNSEIANDFLYQALKGRQNLIMDLRVGSGLPNIQQKAINGFEFLIPTSKSEQTQIASILSKVDEAIKQTEQLIAKYTRIKTGLMQDLLTKGIDEKGNIRSEATHEFKDSPLGRVPKEWRVDNLNTFISYISYGFTNPMPESPEGPYMITAANINQGRILYESSRRTTIKAYEELLTKKSRPKLNDVLITKDGSIGRLAIVDSEYLCINQSVAVMRIKDELVYPLFFKMLLESDKYQDLIIADSGGSTIKHIYVTRIDKMPLAIPNDLEEQKRILEIIESKDLIINQSKTQLAKLQALRTGLMQDLLSGKVRVNHLIKKAETV